MKKILVLALLMSITVFGQNEKYHRAKIIYKTSENFKKLEQLGLAMDHGIHKKGYWLTSDFSDSEIAIARNRGLQVEIEINDVQQFYVDQNKISENRTPENVNCQSSTAVYPTPLNFNLGTMGGYLTYPQMLQELDDMRSLYPNLITAKANVGTFLTSENRALQFVKISQNPEIASSKPQVLYTAIHHAREPISMMQTIFYMWYLLENYATNPEVKNIVDNTEMYFIPVINPDGYIHNQTIAPNGGGMWRKNRRNFGDGTFGVDNNRNYDYWINGNSNQSIWNTLGVSPTTTGETYPGTAAFSEPENQAIKFFVETHNFKIALNAHTFSNLLLYPYGYDLNVPSPDDALFNKISQLLVKESGYTNQIAADLYAASGDSDDFMYGQTFNHSKIFAFTPEIGSSFWPAIAQIIPLCNQMMFTNLTSAKLVLNYANIKDTTSDYIGVSAVFPATFDLTHFGLITTGNYTVSISPVSANITSVGPPVQFTNLALEDEVSAGIDISLALGTATGDDIIYEIVVFNGVFEERKLIYKKYGQFVSVLNNACSAVAPAYTTTTSAWSITTESFVSPSSSITDSPNTNYLANQTKNITLNAPIVLTAGIPGAKISFSAKWELENNFDYVQFQVSTDNGVTWISQCGKYTNQGSTATGQPAGPLFDGVQTDWVQEEIDLSDYLGQTIKVRFRFKSDGFENLDGFYFDDLNVKILQNNNLKTVNSSVSKFSIYPVPSSDFLNINTSENNYSVSIFNLQGQLILQKENNNGFHKVDLVNLSSGMYLLELKSENFIESKKFSKK